MTQNIRAVFVSFMSTVLFIQFDIPSLAATANNSKPPQKAPPPPDIHKTEKVVPNNSANAKESYKIGVNNTYLQGSVTEIVRPSPFLYGSVQTVPKGTKLDLSVMGNLNSQLSKVGDEILARVALNVYTGDKVLLPGGWYMHGRVTNVASQKRLGRDGYVEVEFDKLLSPDGENDLPFNAKFSTKNNELTAIAKTVLVDSGYVTVGAVGGSILSAQMTGIPLAIATHGISIGAGAAAGGGLGLIGALKRKGKIASFFPGDEITITTAEPIILPGFDPRFIPSADKAKAVSNLKLIVDHYAFEKDPYGDKLSRQLSLTVTINNDTRREFSFFDLAVLSDHGERYYPSLTTAGLHSTKTKSPPHSTTTANILFNVGSPKHKYYLILLDKLNRDEIGRCQIN